ncbi:GNAT family N-acetyltransferase [Kitasatospora acidiphila]|uniref:GNAT family N-acetyltransferase n=1 Tax=Kitasatospora acidiphila TaxID=2567942 RepID=UPI0015F0AA65|nr:GNAT family N-acetyltransferase [Kitasatospora acidiphila]
MILRELSPHDAEDVRQIYHGESVRYLGRDEMSATEATEYIARCIAWRQQDPRVQHILGVEVASNLVGVIKLRADATTGRLSYIIRHDCWGRGYATAAVRELLTLAFNPLALTAVSAKHLPENAASGRVLLKAGFALIGEADGFAHYRISLAEEPVNTAGR